jgi:hypothetical protein
MSVSRQGEWAPTSERYSTTNEVKRKPALPPPCWKLPRIDEPVRSDYFARKEFFAPRPIKHSVVAAPQIAILFDPDLTWLFAPISTHRETEPSSGDLDALENLR